MSVTCRHMPIPTRVPVAVVIREAGRVQFIADPRLSEIEVAAAALRLLTAEEIESGIRCECVATSCSHVARLSLFGDGHRGSYPATASLLTDEYASA